MSEKNASVSNLNNPHQVTKAQVGLGNVDNSATAVRRERFNTLIRLAQPLYSSQFSAPLPAVGYCHRLDLKEKFVHHYRRFLWAAEQYDLALENMNWWQKLRHRADISAETRAVSAHRRHAHYLSQRIENHSYSPMESRPSTEESSL